MRDRLVITASQLRRSTQGAGQIVCLKISITSSGFFTRPPRPGLQIEPGSWPTDRFRINRGEKMAAHGEKSAGRQWGLSMAARGEVLMAAVTQLSDRMLST